jgi:hypothetical protein
MRHTALVAIAGPPEQQLSNRSVEAWQYCSGSFSNAAPLYTVVWLDNGQVVNVEHYPNVSWSNCSDFIRSLRWEDGPKLLFKKPQYNAS